MTRVLRPVGEEGWSLPPRVLGPRGVWVQNNEVRLLYHLRAAASQSIKGQGDRVGCRGFRSRGVLYGPREEGRKEGRKRCRMGREELLAFLNTCFGTGVLQKCLPLTLLKFL